MPKKYVKAGRKQKDPALKTAILVIGFFLLAIVSVIYFQTKVLRSSTFCANSISCIKDLSGKRESTNKGVFMGRKVTAPDIPDKSEYALGQLKAVLGDQTGDSKHIYVDLTHQKLYAYDNGNLIYSFLVSSGKWNPTPTGDFRIWIWLRYTRMTGGDKSDGTYYDLPNVPYTMYFYNSVTPKIWGYSLHGTYWHHNFGHPMSHGCINLSIPDAESLYYWTNSNAGTVSYADDNNPGTLITIYGETPKE